MYENHAHLIFDKTDAFVRDKVTRLKLTDDETIELLTMFSEHYGQLADQIGGTSEADDEPNQTALDTRPLGIKAWIETTRHLHEAIGALTNPENKIYPLITTGPELDDLQAAYDSLCALMERGFPPVFDDDDSATMDVEFPQLSVHVSVRPASPDTEAACRNCGCTEEAACDGGCYWVEPNLCSQCVGSDRLDLVDVLKSWYYVWTSSDPMRQVLDPRFFAVPCDRESARLAKFLNDNFGWAPTADANATELQKECIDPIAAENDTSKPPINNCVNQAIEALKYLAKWGTCPSGGNDFPNTECCQQIANELRLSVKQGRITVAPQTVVQELDNIVDSLEARIRTIGESDDAVYAEENWERYLRIKAQIIRLPEPDLRISKDLGENQGADRIKLQPFENGTTIMLKPAHALKVMSSLYAAAQQAFK